MNPFSQFKNDIVKLRKQNGELYEDIKADVQQKKIFIDDDSLPVEEEDIIERILPNGLIEQYRVIDRGFHNAFLSIPAHYQISVEKITGIKKTDSLLNPLAIDEYTTESEIIKNSTPKFKAIYIVLKKYADYPILQMINDLRRITEYHETKQDLCIELIKTKYPTRWAHSTVFVECLKVIIDSDSDFIFRLQLETFHKLLISKIQQDFALKLDEARKQINTNVENKEERTQPFSENNTVQQSKQKNPKVFISYSHDDEQHKQWVENFATKLKERNIDIILDEWHTKLGQLLPNFMEQSISNSQRVICIMTPNYKRKTDKLNGGVGYEYSIITAEIFQSVDTTKFIPLLRNGSKEDAIPISLSGRKYLDMKNDDDFDKNLNDLLRDLSS